MSALLTLLLGIIPLDSIPWWHSGPQPYTYENALADLDRDGDIDLAQGNEFTPVYVYLNTGNGLEQYPSWASALSEGSTAITWGDIDNDGYPELIVGTTQGPIRIYKNNGGTLETTPSWSSNPTGFGAMEIDVADVDCNGYLDIVYTDLVYGVSVYYNDSGIVETDPSWVGATEYYNSCSALGDINGDGFIDLAVGTNSAGYLEQVRIYMNNNGMFETTPSQTITDNWRPMGMVFCDIDNDGDLDLLRGNGGPGVPNDPYPTCAHKNNNGIIESTPFWISSDTTWTMKICAADFNGDGYLDIGKAVYTEYQQPNGVYENLNGNFGVYPSWYSSDYRLSWGALGGDIDGDGLQNAVDTLSGDGARKLFYLPHNNRIPLHSINNVIVNNDTIPITDYCYSLTYGWISFKNPPPSGTGNIIIHYTFSTCNEFIVGNVGAGTVIYHNLGTGVTERASPSITSVICFPNPFVSQTNITYKIASPQSLDVSLRIFDSTGRIVRSLLSDIQSPGMHFISWDGRDDKGFELQSGIYFYQLKVGREVKTGKIVHIK
jgi:hypothetical protein